MGLALIDYSSGAPQGLPDIFPQQLGSVRSDIDNLDLSYISEKRELRITITLAQGISAEDDTSRQVYDGIVIALVDNIAFDLGYPLDPPRRDSYRGTSGSVTIFAAPFIVNTSISATLLPDVDKFKKRLSNLPPTCTLLQEYNAAIHISNPVQQFVAFWGLLTYIAGGDTVKAVENYLHAQGIPMSAGPRGPETKFARVRGEISHLSERAVGLSDIPVHANDILPELRSIVRRAIATNLKLPN